jgi:hypothetical protein
MTKNPNDTPTEKRVYSGRIPTAAIIALEWELANLEHGTASLTLHVRDGRLARFTTGRERSIMAEAGNGE